MTDSHTTPHCAYGNEKTAEQVIDELREENRLLREALGPFAGIAYACAKADEMKKRYPMTTPHENSHRVSVTLGECRRAREVIDARI
jgi:hypothetical protein